jgi:hypothetical protein
LEIKVARNLSLAIGRPAPSFGFHELVAEVRETFAIFVAAGRVASAVDARSAPAHADLKTLGIEKADVLRPPYRF